MFPELCIMMTYQVYYENVEGRKLENVTKNRYCSYLQCVVYVLVCTTCVVELYLMKLN